MPGNLIFGAGEKAKKDLTQALVDSGLNGALDLYRALRTLNPSPYMYYLAYDDIKAAIAGEGCGGFGAG